LTLHLSLTVKLFETLQLSLVLHFSLALHFPDTQQLLPLLQLSLTFILLLFRLPATHVGLLKLPVHVYLRLVYLPPMFELSHCTSWLFLLSASLISNSLKLFFFSFHLFLHSSPIHDGQMGEWGNLNLNFFGNSSSSNSSDGGEMKFELYRSL
jgi:hypothetical protein